MLFGCRPKNVSEPFYNGGKKIVEIIDQYLDFDISADEAHSKIESIRNSLPSEEGSFDEKMISSDAYLLCSYLWHKSPDYNKILETRNELAERLNISAR